MHMCGEDKSSLKNGTVLPVTDPATGQVVADLMAARRRQGNGGVERVGESDTY